MNLKINQQLPKLKHTEDKRGEGGIRAQRPGAVSLKEGKEREGDRKL